MTAPVPLVSAVIAARHGFFTRKGGVSAGPYASLNCSLSSGDDPDLVRQNRAHAAQVLGADPQHLVGLHQVHGANVVQVVQPWRPGEGPRADAMVTARPGIALGIVTADCAPVLFADHARGIVGAAHAGWRGAAGGVLEATIEAMLACGARRGDIHAAIGPCIGQRSYEVAGDMRDAVLAATPALRACFSPGARAERWQFDLQGYCRCRLEQSGVGEVAVIEADTAAEPDRFFSHRRRTLAGGGAIGHQISIIIAAAV